MRLVSMHTITGLLVTTLIDMTRMRAVHLTRAVAEVPAA